MFAFYKINQLRLDKHPYVTAVIASAFAFRIKGFAGLYRASGFFKDHLSRISVKRRGNAVRILFILLFGVAHHLIIFLVEIKRPYSVRAKFIYSNSAHKMFEHCRTYRFPVVSRLEAVFKFAHIPARRLKSCGTFIFSHVITPL